MCTLFSGGICTTTHRWYLRDESSSEPETSAQGKHQSYDQITAHATTKPRGMHSIYIMQAERDDVAIHFYAVVKNCAGHSTW